MSGIYVAALEDCKAKRIICRTLQAIRSAGTLDQLDTAERYSNLAVKRVGMPLFRAHCERELNEAFHRIRGRKFVETSRWN